MENNVQVFWIVIEDHQKDSGLLPISAVLLPKPDRYFTLFSFKDQHTNFIESLVNSINKIHSNK